MLLSVRAEIAGLSVSSQGFGLALVIDISFKGFRWEDGG